MPHYVKRWLASRPRRIRRGEAGEVINSAIRLFGEGVKSSGIKTLENQVTVANLDQEIGWSKELHMEGLAIADYVQLFGAITTAFATIALVYFTRTLAIETRHLAERSSQAHVVATIEPNQWAMNHVDIKVANTGNATAYDVRIAFSPALVADEKHESAPLKSISVLKPNQALESYLVEFAKVKEQVFDVAISWRATPNAKAREQNNYSFAMRQYEGIVRLGSSGPLVQIAEQVKKIREDLRHVTSGVRKLKVDAYTSLDRAEERRQLLEIRNSLMAAAPATEAADLAASENSPQSP